MLVVGDKEAASDSAAVRARGEGDLGPMTVGALVARMEESRTTKR
jgi:threonyl-tRNA synthetase